MKRKTGLSVRLTVGRDIGTLLACDCGEWPESTGRWLKAVNRPGAAQAPRAKDRTEKMARRCQITGAGTRSGNRKATRGKAKYLGGVGTKITGLTKRRFKVNLQNKRIWVPELEQFIRVRLSVRALKTITKKGAYRTLIDAGILQPPK